MAQQTKVELLLQLKDRISSGITKAKETMSRNNQEMRQSIERLKKNKREVVVQPLSVVAGRLIFILFIN